MPIGFMIICFVIANFIVIGLRRLLAKTMGYSDLFTSVFGHFTATAIIASILAFSLIEIIF
ncbi:MAG: hypothetical protein ACRDDX_02265 [Cellulosilyticaceae bacterium]